MTTNDFPVTAAESALRSAEQHLESLRAAIREAERQIPDAEQAIQRAQRDLLRARAAESRNAIPVGTRVRHYYWEDNRGTVVENDGTGLAILQDNASEPTYGFEAREWVPID